MAYGVQSINSKIGDIKFNPGIVDSPSQSGVTQQIDTVFFTDFLQNTFTTTSPASGGVLYGVNANGGSFTANSTTDRDLFGANGCIGVLQCATGTTNNTTGYSGFATAAILPGIPTPTTGFVTEYEMECALRMPAAGSTFSTTVPGFIRMGFSSAMTNATPNDGIFFEYSQTNTTSDGTWFITYYNDAATVRVNTTVAVNPAKTYQFYLAVSKDTSGNYTTEYRIKNVTDSTDTGLQTASPSGGNAAYPSDTADTMVAGAVCSKQSLASATSRSHYFDYFGSRIRFPITRAFLNIGL